MNALVNAETMTTEAIKTIGNSGVDNKNLYRTMPSNINAEQVLLGALLINNDSINQVGDFLRHDHFYEPVHQRIYEAIQKFVDKGLLANPVTLKNYFDKDEALASLGGAAYLIDLASAAGSIINIKDYAKTIYDLALKRKLIDIGEEVVNTAFADDIDVSSQNQIESAEQKLFNLANEGSSEKSYEHLSKAVIETIKRTESAYKNRGKVTGITSGFSDVDKLLGGFQKSDLLILAGRPSMGKTALATNFAMEAAKALRNAAEAEGLSGKDIGSIAFFSLEMSSEQLASRLLSSVSGINSTALRRGELNESDFASIVKGSQELASMPFFIDDTPAISISALRTRARRLKRQHNLSMIIVDYLQLMRSNSDQAKTNRVLEISEITQGLKAIAKELNIPVIALSQLSRAVEQRDDKRPQLSDLRESGSIEQDADVVLFVFREEYYVARKMPPEGTDAFADWQKEMDRVHGITEVIVAKQRNGPIGIAKLHFDAAKTKFSLAVDSGISDIDEGY